MAIRQCSAHQPRTAECLLLPKRVAMHQIRRDEEHVSTLHAFPALMLTGQRWCSAHISAGPQGRLGPTRAARKQLAPRGRGRELELPIVHNVFHWRGWRCPLGTRRLQHHRSHSWPIQNTSALSLQCSNEGKSACMSRATQRTAQPIGTECRRCIANQHKGLGKKAFSLHRQVESVQQSVHT